MKVENNITLKNYIFLSIILVVSVILVIYFYMWYGEIEETKANTPVMDEYLNVVNYNELADYLIENKDVFIYVSVLDDIETRKFEKKFKKIVYNYDLNNSILYLNLTDESDKIISKFMKDYNIDSLPCVISFKNGKVISLFNISNKNYDIELLISYFRIEGVIND